ncbi:MAG: hypothetical protein M1826_006673 [Phylliscum demangeonii]|nr:MAG: hypothetical protein M1826_006673 [Phylliscum demangeonii]
MTFASQRLRAIRLPLLFFLVSLTIRLGTAAPFQGRGQLQVLALAHSGFQPAGYVSWEGVWVDGSNPNEIGVFDSQRTGAGKGRAMLRTTRHTQCVVAGPPSPPVLDCSEPLSRSLDPLGPIVADRIQTAWATFTPEEAATANAPAPAPAEGFQRPRQQAFISFVRLDLSDYRLQLKWMPVR